MPGFSIAEPALVRGMLADAAAIGGVEHALVVLTSTDSVQAREGGEIVRGDFALSDAPAFDLLIVCGGEGPVRGGDGARAPIVKALTDAAEVMVVGSAHHGLARHGLLAGLTLALPWHGAQRYLAQNSDHRYTDRIFARTGKWWSVAGGVSVLDALLAWLAAGHGTELANSLASRWMLARVRASEERQPVPLGSGAGPAVDPKVARTVALMEANLEEPLTTDQIAERIGVSRRQLERLFKRHLEAVPSQYYLELRLQRARQLLRATRQSIVQIGLACGFASGPHFSSAYRNRFGMTPREDRLKGDPEPAQAGAAERGED
ncbi:GlxA family transcriptional regulator [Niveibacterium sp. 24ML]|uniref:GlxA family transcriptional regulator n=1 Tax=Niveibacterium sp. 24ML TaxID=2985512 RepID=UPI002B4BDE93|nr:helix-turn-helix domain-containing protein [Niveibacterium sp. 24ML]